MQSSIELSTREIASILAEVQNEMSGVCVDAQRGFLDFFHSPISESLRNRIVTTAFGLALVLVAMASIYDAFLVYKFREAIDEQNPICRWLISFDPESVSVFLFAKLTSTFLVVYFASLLFKYWRRAGVLVAISLLAFQIGLMCYLHLVDTY